MKEFWKIIITLVICVALILGAVWVQTKTAEHETPIECVRNARNCVYVYV